MSLALLGTLLVFVVLAIGADESWAATLAVIIAVAATAAVHWPTPSYRAFQVGLLIFLSGIGGLLVLLTELEANENPPWRLRPALMGLCRESLRIGSSGVSSRGVQMS